MKKRKKCLPAVLLLLLLLAGCGGEEAASAPALPSPLDTLAIPPTTSAFADCVYTQVDDVPQEVFDAVADCEATLNTVYAIVRDGECAGYAFDLTAPGFWEIRMLVSVDYWGAIADFGIIESKETSGMGSRVLNNDPTDSGTGALDQFIGRTDDGDFVIGEDVDAVSGATLTLEGVTRIVRAALAAADIML